MDKNGWHQADGFTLRVYTRGSYARVKEIEI